MAVLIKALRIGVIAEEWNDIDVIYELTCKIIKENQFSFLKFAAHGCGKLQKKCSAWAENLLARGCSHLVVIHDLDKRDEKELRTMLENEIRVFTFDGTVVLVPIRAIEAWLLSDSKALKTVFNMRKLPKVPKSPEELYEPKKILGELVKQNSKAQYLNTIHNRRIAKEISFSKLRRCRSFLQYPEFLIEAFPKASSRVS